MRGNREANCIAVIGPANAGKTTLLHQLDEKLRHHLHGFLVLKGNPDGTGRYLFHARQLRNDPEAKAEVKGSWGSATVDRICDWITHGRRNLSLALLDFGGRHDDKTRAGNARMLACCSHYLLVTRKNALADAEYWDEIGRTHGLTRVGWMQSVAYGSEPPEVLRAGEEVEATFQVDVPPSDTVNEAVVRAVIARLVELSRPADDIPYVRLWRPEDWREEDLADVGGQAAKIRELVSRTGTVVLGGQAPIWAYLAGLRCALDTDPKARVFFFDPRQPERLVEIPGAGGAGLSDFPADSLRVSWTPDGERSVLRMEITSIDKILPPVAAQNLAGAPQAGCPPTSDVGLYGAGPTWLYGVYARRMAEAGVRRLASFDRGRSGFVQVLG